MTLPVSLNVRQKLSITEVTPDGFLYVQLDIPETRNLEQLSQDILEVVEATLPATIHGFKPSISTKCFAQSLLDDLWYRSIVKEHDTTTDTFAVHYVDYGNHEDSIPISRLFPPVTDLFDLPFQAVKCQLAYFTPTVEAGDWVIGVRENVLNQTIPGIFHQKMAASNDTYYSVTLYWDDSEDNYTVQEELVAMGLGTYQPLDSAHKSSPTSDTINQPSVDSFPNLELTVGQQYNVYVTYAETSDVVWCQLSSNTNTFQNLVIELQEHLQQSLPLPVISNPSKNPPPLNEPCCVLYSEDYTWCRGLVAGVDVPSNTVDVLFVDFGNTEVIPLPEVLSLPPKFLSIPAQAASVSMYGLKPIKGVWSPEGLEHFKGLHTDQELICNVECLDDDGYPSVRLMNINLGCDIAEVLIKEGYAERHGGQPANIKSGTTSEIKDKPSDASSSTASSQLTFKTISLPVESTFKGSVTHINSLKSFYIQLCDHAEDLVMLTEHIEAHVKSPDARPIEMVKAGMPVLAQFVEDKQWYRAYMKPPDGVFNDWGVVFVDFGNWQKINIGTLKEISSALMDYTVQSFCCSLNDYPLSDMKNTAAIERFSQLAQDQLIECTVIRKTSDKDGRNLYMVEIFKDGVNILDHLLQIEGSSSSEEKGQQVPSIEPLTVPMDEKVLVTVSHIESTTRFACQLVDNTEAIETLQAKLNNEYTSDQGGAPLVNPVIGTPCVALWDNQWYRAVIKEFSCSNEVEVFFVDYGNTDVVPLTNTRTISQEFINALPCQSIICCLDGIPSSLVEQSTELFIEMCLENAMEALFFNMKRTVSEPLPCKLFTPDTESLVSKELLDKIAPQKQILYDSPLCPAKDHAHLAPPSSRSGSRSRQSSDTSLIQSLCIMVPTQFKATVSYVNSPSEFFIQQNTNEDKLSSLLEDMYKYYGTQKKGFPLQSPYVGIHCSAPYSDGNFYRGRVCQMDQNNCSVFYIDYGNIESVLVKDLFALSSRFTSLPAQAVKCSLSGVAMATGATPTNNWSDTCIQVLKDTILEQEVTVDLLTPLSDDGYEVKVQVQDQDLSKMLTEAGLLFAAPSKPSTSQISSTTVSTRASSISSTPPPGNLAVPQLTVAIGTTIEATVTAITARLYIYCQLLSNTDMVTELVSAISKYVSTNPKPIEPSKVKKGMYVLAQFTEDDSWYRGKVLSLDKGVKIGYIDYGNLEVLPLARICELPGVLYDFPSQAIRCQISGLEDCQLSNVAKTTVDEKLLFNNCSLQIIKKESGQRYIVEMNFADDGSSVKDWLISSDLVSNPSSLVSQQDSKLSIHVTKPETVQPLQPSSNGVVIPTAISSLPQDQTLFNGYLSHIDSLDRFYCQPLTTSEQLQSLANDMQSHYENQVKPKNAPPVVAVKGQFVAALYSLDSSWSRAQVQDVSKGTHVRVLFCDYGNIEDVPTSNVQRLEPQFASLPCQAVPCCLIGLQPIHVWTQNDSDVFINKVQENCLEMKVKRMSTTCLEIIDIKTENGVDVCAELVKNGIACKPRSSPTHAVKQSSKKRWNSGSSNSSTSSNQTPSTVTKLAPFNVNEGDIISVYVTHNNEDDDVVWVQPAAQEPELLALTESVAEVYTPSSIGRLSLNNVKPGRVCCAQFTADDKWYRARITDVHDDETVSVHFVDYGNSDVVDSTRLCYLVKEFLTLHLLAIPCVFTTPTLIPEIDSEDSINVQFIKKLPKSNTWQVDALTNNSAPPAPSPYPRPHSPYIAIPVLTLKDDKQYQVYIVHTESPSSFWCQLVSSSEALEDLMALIADYYTDKSPVVNMEPDNYCVAQFSDNNSWYRAKIIEVLEDNQVYVVFVDYGNEEIVSIDKVAGLDPQFASLPCQAFRCSLFDVISNAFDEKHLESFYSLDFSNSFGLTLNRHLPQGAWLVHLVQKDGQCVNDIFNSAITSSDDNTTEATPTYPTPQFTPLSEIDVYVTSVISPDSFFCQPLMMATELEELMNSIHDYMSQLPKGKKKDVPIDTINIGQSCLALFGSDEDWFRAQVEDIDLDKNQVLVYYIDYGNMSYLSPDQLAPLPRQFLSVPAQVIQCSALSMCSEEQPLDSDKIEIFSQLVQEECQYLITISSFSQSTHKYTVQVHSNLFNKTHESYLQTQLLNSVGVSLNVMPSHTSTSSIDELAKDVPDNSGTIEYNDSKTPTTDIEDDAISDSGSVTTGEPLIHAPCKLSLASGETVNVFVVHVQDPSQLFIQRIDCSTEFNSLSQEITQYCSDFADTLVQETYRTGDFVLAFYDRDSVWYRGYVEDVLQDHLLSVQFIDYGNTGTVPSNKVVMCPGNFLELPIQAIPCSLSQVPNREAWPDHYKTLLDDAVSGIELKLTVIVTGGQGMAPSVELCNIDGTNDLSQMILDKLQEECESDKASEYEGEKVSNEVIKEENTSDHKGGEDTAVEDQVDTSEVNEEEVIEGDEGLINAGEEKLNWTEANGEKDGQTHVKEEDESVGINEGGVVDTPTQTTGNQNGGDGSRVIADTNMSDVNTDTNTSDVNTDTNTSLVNTDTNTSHVNTDTNTVDDSDIVDVKLCDTNTICDDTANRSSTSDNPCDPKQEALTEAPSPVPRVLKVGSKCEVYLINVNSPYDIVCQLFSDSSVLDSITSILEQIYTTPIESKYDFEVPPVKGEFVCAKYSKDDRCYRAKVMEYCEDTKEYTIEFIDYGNQEIVKLDDLKKLDPRLVSFSTLALYCGLSGLPDEDPDCSDHFTSTLNNEILNCLKDEDLLSMEVRNVYEDGSFYDVELSNSTVCINDIVREVMNRLLREHSSTGTSSETASPRHQPSVDPIATTDHTPPDHDTQDYATAYPVFPFQPSDTVAVVVSPWSTLTDIHCQIVDHEKLQAIDDAFADVSEQYMLSDSGLVATDIVQGFPVMVVQSTDGSNPVCSRSLVMSKSSDKVMVKMADTGVEEEYSLASVKRLPLSVASVSSPLAFTCQLPHLLETDLVPDHGFGTEAWELEWPEHAFGHFYELVRDRMLTAKIVSLAKDDSITVELSYEKDGIEINVREAIITKLKEAKPVVLLDDSVNEETVADDEQSTLKGAEL